MPWDKQFNELETLDRALSAFWERGYEATSVQDLVDRTGVNRASLYATYGDKRALFLAALETYDQQRKHLLDDLRRLGRPREAIRKLFLSFLSDVSDASPGRGCFLTNTALELAAHDREIRRVVAAAQEEVEAFLVDMVRAGKASGEFAGHIKATETARGLLASLLGFLVLIRSRPDRPLLTSIVDDALKRLS